MTHLKNCHVARNAKQARFIFPLTFWLVFSSCLAIFDCHIQMKCGNYAKPVIARAKKKNKWQ